MKSKKVQCMKLKGITRVLKTYSFTEKLAFVFNALQSVLSELILAFLSAYILNSIFTGQGSVLLAVVLVIMAACYFVLFVPLWGYWMECGQARFKKKCSDRLMEGWIREKAHHTESVSCAHFLDIQQIDVEKVSEFGGWTSVVLLQSVLSGLAASISILAISWKIFLVLLLVGVIPIVVDGKMAARNRRLLRQSRRQLDEKGRTLLCGLNNQRLFRVFDYLPKWRQVFLTTQKQTSTLQEQTALRNTRADFIHDLVFEGLFRVIILVGGLLLAANGEISIGAIAFMLSMSEGLSFFLGNVGTYWRQVQELQVSLEHLEEMSKQNLCHPRKLRSQKAPVSGLSMRHVYFSYDKSAPLLIDANATFVQRGRYLIEGRNGAGKSTLLKLLFGYYSPDQGTITCLPEKIDPASSCRIGYVGQQVQLFSGSWQECLKANSQKEIEKVLALVGLEGIWKCHPVIEENGANFSLGERARITLARALLQKPDILLLDEVDAHVDKQTFEMILDAIEKYLPEACVVAISHAKQATGYIHFQHLRLVEGKMIL